MIWKFSRFVLEMYVASSNSTTVQIPLQNCFIPDLIFFIGLPVCTSRDSADTCTVSGRCAASYGGVTSCGLRWRSYTGHIYNQSISEAGSDAIL